jgi:hypothetical protein
LAEIANVAELVDGTTLETRNIADFVYFGLSPSKAPDRLILAENCMA